jgi:hypothetical protein
MLTALAALAVATATPAKSEAAPANPMVTVPSGKQEPAKNKSSGFEDIGKFMAMFDKIFPPQPDPEPARLAAARGVAGQMWPDGTFGGLLDSYVTTMADAVLGMKPAELELMFNDKKNGKAKPIPAADANLTLRDQLRRDDPHFDRRVAVLTEAIRAEFVRLSPVVEPQVREGLSRAMARRFSDAQLADLGAFYRTPTGQVYARESLKMWFDSDVMRASFNAMPAIVMQLPGAMQRVETAMKAVPPAPKRPKKAPAK